MSTRLVHIPDGDTVELPGSPSDIQTTLAALGYDVADMEIKVDPDDDSVRFVRRGDTTKA